MRIDSSRSGLMRTSLVLTVAAVAAGCGGADATRPPDPSPPDPSMSLSGPLPASEVAAAVAVIADAALRLAPALADTPARQRLVRELGEAAIATGLRDWARAARALDAAQAILDRYAATAPTAEEADLAAIRLAIDHTRTVLPS